MPPSAFNDRQASLKELQPGQRLVLIREPQNEHDPNAIMVADPRRKKTIGYVPREAAAQLAQWLDDGGEARASVFKVVGSGKDFFSAPVLAGLKILVTLG